jgi:hypothetical protein
VAATPPKIKAHRALGIRYSEDPAIVRCCGEVSMTRSLSTQSPKGGSIIDHLLGHDVDLRMPRLMHY